MPLGLVVCDHGAGGTGMEEEHKKYLAFGVLGTGLLVLLLATRSSCRSGGDPNQLTLPQDTYWACQNPICKNTFSVSRADLISYQKAHPTAPTPPCPKCGKNKVVSATKCPHCGTLYPSVGGKGRLVCPKCGQPAAGPA